MWKQKKNCFCSADILMSTSKRKQQLAILFVGKQKKSKKYERNWGHEITKPWISKTLWEKKVEKKEMFSKKSTM